MAKEKKTLSQKGVVGTRRYPAFVVSHRMDLPYAVEAAMIEQHRKRFEAGDKSALFAAIRFCFNQEIVAPEWIVDAFFKATNKWYSMEVKELGEAFGVEWLKGRHVGAMRKRRRLKFAVLNAVKEASARGRAVDDELFGEIGRRLRPPIGKTQAKEYYKAARAAFNEPQPAIELLLTDFVVRGHRKK